MFNQIGIRAYGQTTDLQVRINDKRLFKCTPISNALANAKIKAIIVNLQPPSSTRFKNPTIIFPNYSCSTDALDYLAK